MKLERLRELLPESLQSELDQRYEAFSAEHGDDVGAFVSQLHANGEITNEHLREILTSEAVHFVGAPNLRNGESRARYERLTVLGKGSMGEVHVAHDHELHRYVALKRMHPHMAKDRDHGGRFYTEVQITAQLDHPCIVPVHGLERDEDGVPCYAMKLVRGKNLKVWLADVVATYDRGELPDDDHDLPARLAVFLDICNAMAYAHSRGVIHRDLKPENIMVGAYHQVLVMDWGIARLVEDREQSPDIKLTAAKMARTRAGIAIGTPRYMSPEQARGLSEELDARSDQYTLGLILYEMVSLKKAISGKNAIQVTFRAAEGWKAPLEHYSPDVRIPTELAAIIDKATAVDPENRYPDVETLADDVRRYLRDEAISARPDTTGQKVQRWIGRHRSTALITGVVLAAMVVLVALAGVAGAMVVLEQQREVAAQHERALGQLVAIVDGRAHRIDTELQRYASLLTGLAYATEHAMEQDVPAEPSRLYLDSDFLTEGQAPPDLAVSPSYGAPISLAAPVIKLAPDVDLEILEPELQKLMTVQPWLEQVVLQSRYETAGRRERNRKHLRAEGMPVVWSFVALDEGALVAFPGKGEITEDYDPRDRPWYHHAQAGPGPRWGTAYVDASGMGLLVPCSRALRSRSGSFLGVAGMDVSLTHLVDLLVPEDLEGEAHAYLVDKHGRVVVETGMTADVTEYEAEFFPHWDQLEGGHTGHAEVDGEQPHLIVFSRLRALDWTYVVMGATEQILPEP